MSERALLTPREFFSPLMLAGYAAWAAAWYGTVGALAARDPMLGWLARGALLVFLGAFLLAAAFDADLRPRRFGWALVLMGTSVLGLLMLGPSNTSFILLVVLAAMLAVKLAGATLAAMLVVINLIVLVVLIYLWGAGWPRALSVMFGIAAFQAFAALMTRMAVRAEINAATLRQVNADLLATRALLSETARDQERLRLSRELHDVAGHKLTALKLNLRTLARDPALRHHKELACATIIADELLDDLRGVVRQLRQYDGMDLGEALQRLAETLPRPNVAIQVDAQARIPHTQQAETLLRVAQEGLTNAARHGHAQRAWLHLRRVDDQLQLEIVDDGRVRWPLTEGTGLTGMRERIQALGGTLQLEPSRCGGLTLRVRLPLVMPS